MLLLFLLLLLFIIIDFCFFVYIYRSCWRRSFVYISCIIASIGGILYGYDIGIIAGALPQLTKEFCLNDIEKEIAVSSLLLGAFLASLIVG